MEVLELSGRDGRERRGQRRCMVCEQDAAVFLFFLEVVLRRHGFRYSEDASLMVAGT
jgi:hypothetical protein